MKINIKLPDILLNLTPLRLSLGSLQTSISHWNWLSYIQTLTKSLIDQIGHLVHLDQGVGVGISVDAKQEESLPLLVITVVCVQHLQRKNCKKYILYQGNTFLISAMISLGSLLLVVFMLQVNRSDRGLIWRDENIQFSMVFCMSPILWGDKERCDSISSNLFSPLHSH